MNPATRTEALEIELLRAHEEIKVLTENVNARRHSLAQEIAETLRTRGHWVPKDVCSADLITAVGMALDKPEPFIVLGHIIMNTKVDFTFLASHPTKSKDNFKRDWLSFLPHGNGLDDLITKMSTLGWKIERREDLHVNL